MPVFPLMTGVVRSENENPIMGPPVIIRQASSFNPPQNSIISPIEIPSGTNRFLGVVIPLPVTLNTLCVKYLPFNTLVEVENLDNSKKVLVRINDRGPFVEGRVIDLSRKAAQRIGIADTGTARVRLRIVKAADTAGIPQNEPTEPGTNQETGIEKEEISVVEVTETDIPKSTVPPPTAPPPTVHGDNPLGYYLQAGAFSSMKNAKRQVREIKRILPGISFNIQYIDGLYKIISDRLGSRETAETFKNHLGKNGIEAIIRE